MAAGPAISSWKESAPETGDELRGPEAGVGRGEVVFALFFFFSFFSFLVFLIFFPGRCVCVCVQGLEVSWARL